MAAKERNKHTILLLTLLSLLPFSSLLSEEETAQSLADKSPFLPPETKAKNEPKAPVQVQGPLSRELEFRGVMSMNGRKQFSLYNRKEQKGYWIAEDEEVQGIRMSNFDSGSSTVTVSMNGRTERLSMIKAKETPMPVASSQTAPPKATPAVTPPAATTPKPANANRRVIPRRRLILPKNSNSNNANNSNNNSNASGAPASPPGLNLPVGTQ